MRFPFPPATGVTALEMARGTFAAQLLQAVRHPPLWVPDDQARTCMLCREPFTAMRRRHHCRHCGIVCCGPCSREKVPLPKFRVRERVRCCNACCDADEEPAAELPTSVPELRALIERAGLAHADCVEKPELRERAREGSEGLSTESSVRGPSGRPHKRQWVPMER